MKVDKLTDEQTARFPEFVSRWKAVGLSTEPLNFDKAVAAAKKCYRLAGLQEPQRFFQFGGPISAAIGATIIDRFDERGPSAKVSDVDKSVYEKCKSVIPSVAKQLKTTQACVLGLLASQDKRKFWEAVRSHLSAQIYGSHEAGWLSFYSFFREVCDLKEETEPLTGIMEMSEVCGWWAPYQNACIFQDRHNALHLNEEGQLHCENGPAVAYPDGFEVYALNGVRMTKENVMTPAEKMDPKKIVKETNAEIRRELVRKIGMERFIQEVGAKVLDRTEDGMYELIQVKLDRDMEPGIFLKMINPSIGTWHVEGVERHCKTVQDALNYRAGLLNHLSEDWKPSQLT